MLKFYPLFSGSKGNSELIISDKAKILIDIGVSFKRLNEALKSIDLSINDIDAIFITHEHSDHCKALEQILKHTSIPIYATSGTFEALNIDGENIYKINNMKNELHIYDLIVSYFNTSHDCNMPCGYIVKQDDKKISISTDLGVITPQILEKMSNSNLVYIESNHDTEMLKMGRYPFSLKRRILGNYGHLSNDACAEAISYLTDKGVNNFILAHLSEENNTPEIAMQTVTNYLSSLNIDITNLNIDIATQDFNKEEYIL